MPLKNQPDCHAATLLAMTEWKKLHPYNLSTIGEALLQFWEGINSDDLGKSQKFPFLLIPAKA